MAETKEVAEEYSAIRLPKELVHRLGIIAKHKQKTIGKMVADWIDARVQKDYRTAVESLHAELGESGA